MFVENKKILPFRKPIISYSPNMDNFLSVLENDHNITLAFKLIYGNAQLLILDEPTAAMDAISEKNFYEKYISLAKNKSCILISHRLKSTSFCDSIIVMENGKIIEKGTHESLMNEDTHYKSMYQIQSSYYQ